MFEKYGKPPAAFIPHEYRDYRTVPPDRVGMLPLGSTVLVRDYGGWHPYVIVRWGKHRKKRLKYLGHFDWNLGFMNDYLPIRESKWLKFKIKERGRKRK